MQFLQKSGIVIFFLITGLLFQYCSPESKKKVIYINSYHKGHPSSDEIMKGFVKNMPADTYDIYSFYMDTKRNTSAEYIENKARVLLDTITMLNPEILVVSDDNAVKYLVEPNLNQLSMPIVFCGVNWTADEYKLPHKQVTGILEILPVCHAVRLVKENYPEARKLLVLNENTTTSRKEKQILHDLFLEEGLTTDFSLVDDFEHWETAFIEGNRNYDIIYFSTHAAIRDWNHNEAVKVIADNIKIPVFTCEDFMMPYAVLGVTKIASEHGIWAASTTKKILSGSTPADFSITRNTLSNTWLNKRLAEIIAFNPDSILLQQAKIINDSQ